MDYKRIEKKSVQDVLYENVELKYHSGLRIAKFEAQSMSQVEGKVRSVMVSQMCGFFSESEL